LLKKSAGQAATGFIDADGGSDINGHDVLGDLDDHPF